MANIATYFRGFLTELPNHPCGTALRKRTGYTTLTSSKFLLVWVVLGALESPCVQCQIYKVGVLGPWDCDPVFSMALPGLAAQLAVGRINNDLSLDLGQKVDFVILQEACNTSTALVRFLQSKNLVQAFVGPTNPGYCNAAALSGKDWDVAVFSWACADYELDRVLSYPTFTRTLPSPTQVLFTVLKYFGWASVGIVSSNDDLWTDNAGKLAISLRRLGLPVGIVASMGDNSTEMEQTLRKIQDPRKIKIIIMCMHSLLIGGELQAAFLLKASEMGMTSGGFVFIPYDTLLYSLPYTNTSYPQLQDNAGLRQAYDAVLTITVASESMTFREAYDMAKNKGEINSSYDPQQVSPLFGTVYNSIYLLAKAMHNSRRAGQWLSGTNLASFAKNTTFAGFNQDVNTGTQGVGLTRYVVLDTDGQGSQLYSSHVVDLSKGTLIPTGSSSSFPGGSPPAADPSCWFEPNTICTKGVELTYVILVPVIIFVLGFSGVGVTLLFRRRSHQMQLVKGPNRILLTVEDLSFLDPELSKKTIVMDAIEQKNGKNSGLSTSMHSIMPSTTKASNIALLQGDWVWLKKFEKGQFKSIKRSTTKILTKMRDLRHENITLFLGFFMDGDYTFAVVTEHCSRGSLQDLLCSHDIKLDWMFKSSLLLDLIKGMKYLHHRELPHGHLNSRNCVVDGRFVLKITDYGFNELLESQNTSKNLPPAQDLLWTAPEHLRDWENTQKGTCKGDVYSFAIILQEVVVRGLPYCMVALSPEEIIRKVKKPPPMCRPTVTPDQAPMECIQLMKQSWAEQPDRRPSFNEIYNQFKTINKGKKTNIVDSMLRMLEDYSSNLEDLIQERTKELEVEKQRTEKLLSQMLPPSVAEALKTGTTVEPEYFDQVTIYFSDIVGFTTISALSEPIEVVDLLNDLYTLFDAVLSNHDVYKVETIGDAYMVASGLPKRNGNKHAAEIANMSLDILSAVGSFKMHHMPDIPVRIRIGLHSGSCVAGVVGLTMPRYCLFGDTVNTASRMESTGLPYRIHVNASTVNILQSLNEGYQVDVRGNTELKGKGTEETYWLVGKTGFLKPLPKPTEIKPGDNNHGLLPEEIAEYKRKKSERKA